ncbi:MAG: acyltransferase [Actinomycetia bacterium]|nr:acyltransferase [Actinomycetes bacterium]
MALDDTPVVIDAGIDAAIDAGVIDGGVKTVAAETGGLSRSAATAASAKAPRLALDFRGDIEGLRAIAVVIVVLFHARVGPFEGGFIGVDVFFVVSGFLITSLLLREAEAEGKVSLAAFWARRARRLLPASLVVIVATLIAARILLNPLDQRDITDDAFAATFFAVNFVFGFLRVGYFASQQSPSPLLHYWSLAVEEQYYFVWPVVVALLVHRGRRVFGDPASMRRRIGIVLAIVWVPSFIACVTYSNDTEWAFYMLPTRAWELATGALVAVALPRLRRISKQVRAIFGWLALIGLAAATMGIDQVMTIGGKVMSYPSAIALAPVLTTAVLLAFGDVRRNVGPSRLLALPPLQWIGGRSYAIYLWHWPLLVIGEVRWGPLSAGARGGLALASVALAAVSYVIVENPIRHNPRLVASPSLGLRVGGAMLVVAGLASIVSVAFPESVTGKGTAAAPTLATVPATVATGSTVATESTTAPTTPVPANDTVSGSTNEGVLALRAANYAVLEEALSVEQVPANIDPPLFDAQAQEPEIYSNGCHLPVEVLVPRECVYGDPNSTTSIVLFGDSHAAQWFPAIRELADEHGWRLDVITKSGCPTALISQDNQLRDGRCDGWRENVVDWVKQRQPDLVIMVARAYTYLRGDVWEEGLTDTVSKMRPSVGQILIVGDTPDQHEIVPDCLAEHLSSATDCLTTREDGVNLDVLEAERSVAAAFNAHFEPTTDWVCTLDGCPVIVGNLLVYRDDNHLTTNAVMLLKPYLNEVISAALADVG